MREAEVRHGRHRAMEIRSLRRGGWSQRLFMAHLLATNDNPLRVKVRAASRGGGGGGGN